MVYDHTAEQEERFWSGIDNFKQKEFLCKCGCGEYRINHQLVKALDMAVSEMKRERKGFLCIVTSGCRCEKHNASLAGSVKTSSHLVKTTIEGQPDGSKKEIVRECLAVDISCPTSEMRYFMLPYLFRYFRRIEVSDRHIHVDIDYEKPQNVLFFPPGTNFGWRK